MKPYLQDADVTLYCGDALEVLAGLPDGSVDCCVTSPPYWGLRDYGVPGQLGLEETPTQYVERMVDVFREVRRVLASQGTCWLNLGDSYAGSWGAQGRTGQMADRSVVSARQIENHPKFGALTGLKPKDLVGVPWRVAFALQADGWWLRSDIVWSKPNPMPESVTDRPTKSHEYLFLLAKQPRYFFDQEAVREKYAYPEDAARYRVTGDVPGQTPHGASRAKGPDGRRATRVVGADGSLQHRDGERWPNPAGRNVRSVWEIATQPYPEAHFATFPEELVRRAILAGCPEWCCATCGRPRERVVTEYGLDVDRPQARRALEIAERAGLTEAHLVAIRDAGIIDGKKAATQTGIPTEETARLAAEAKAALGGYYREFLLRRPKAFGWSTCPEHGELAAYRPGIVLDPFMGSGTTALVARKHGRHAVGIDLNPDYCALAARRLSQLSLFAEAA